MDYFVKKTYLFFGKANKSNLSVQSTVFTLIKLKVKNNNNIGTVFLRLRKKN